MSALTPRFGIFIKNDSGEDIPPRSVVVCTSVEITTATTENESVAIHHVTKYTGQAGNIFVTGESTVRIPTSGSPGDDVGWWSSTASYGTAYSDQFVYVAIDPVASTPVAGEEWGPVTGEWFIGPTGNGFIAQGYPSGGTEDRAMFYRSSGSGAGGDTPNTNTCGCCDCFDCITDAQATVTGCTAAPDGAATTYEVLGLSYPSYSEVAGDHRLYNGVMASACGSSSSSSSGGCLWTSCLISVTRANPSSSSSSSSSSTGVYQWTLDLGVATPTFTLTFVSGTDVIGLGW